MPTVMPGSMSCSSADGLSRRAAGRMCGANSSMSTPPPARLLPRKRSIALASSTRSRKSSTDCHPSGDDSGASSSQSRLPRHWPLGPTAPCASSRANPSSPRPSAICGRAGPRWCAVSTTAGWRSTTIPPSAPCAVSRLVAKIICLPAPTTALHTAHPVMPLIDRIDFAGAHRAADVATGAYRPGGVSRLLGGRLAE